MRIMRHATSPLPAAKCIGVVPLVSCVDDGRQSVRLHDVHRVTTDRRNLHVGIGAGLQQMREDVAVALEGNNVNGIDALLRTSSGSRMRSSS